MHDAKGRPLNVGDRVLIPAIVAQLDLGEDYCNVGVKSALGRRPDGTKESISAINTGVLLRCGENDLNDLGEAFGPAPSPVAPGAPRHPAVASVLQFFAFGHLPPALQEVSRPFSQLADRIADGPQNAESTVALRKLLEAKDAAVRAVLFKPPSPAVSGA